MAFTWRTREGEPGECGDYAVLIDGEPIARDRFGSAPTFWPGGLTGNAPFLRRETDETIVLGPMDGTIADLRISDSIRYQARFAPPETLPPPDAQTRVQFRFDGDHTGETAPGAKITCSD